MPQLFMLPDSVTFPQPAALLSKVVDDILIAVTADINVNIPISIHDRFLLGTIILGPGALCFFGLTATHRDYYSISIDGDDKLNALECLPLSCMYHKAFSESITSIEFKAFPLIICLTGWQRINASPFCFEIYSQMQ